MAGRFTWSLSKATRNLRKHGISFKEACDVFSDPYLVVVEDCETEEGVRYHAIGYVRQQLLAVVVYVDQTEDETLLHFHLISARRAESQEELLYAQQFS